ncbi:unnamed protein product [Amoebophrya sp. A120]|nr:unnamed protein product [Amoebophrya sp. A120]|eukprot:GSA120T00018581001.1
MSSSAAARVYEPSVKRALAHNSTLQQRLLQQSYVNTNGRSASPQELLSSFEENTAELSVPLMVTILHKLSQDRSGFVDRVQRTIWVKPVRDWGETGDRNFDIGSDSERATVRNSRGGPGTWKASSSAFLSSRKKSSASRRAFRNHTGFEDFDLLNGEDAENAELESSSSPVKASSATVEVEELSHEVEQTTKPDAAASLDSLTRLLKRLQHTVDVLRGDQISFVLFSLVSLFHAKALRKTKNLRPGRICAVQEVAQEAFGAVAREAETRVGELSGQALAKVAWTCATVDAATFRKTVVTVLRHSVKHFEDVDLVTRMAEADKANLVFAAAKLLDGCPAKQDARTSEGANEPPDGKHQHAGHNKHLGDLKATRYETMTGTVVGNEDAETAQGVAVRWLSTATKDCTTWQSSWHLVQLLDAVSRARHSSAVLEGQGGLADPVVDALLELSRQKSALPIRDAVQALWLLVTRLEAGDYPEPALEFFKQAKAKSCEMDHRGRVLFAVCVRKLHLLGLVEMDEMRAVLNALQEQFVLHSASFGSWTATDLSNVCEAYGTASAGNPPLRVPSPTASAFTASVLDAVQKKHFQQPHALANVVWFLAAEPEAQVSNADLMKLYRRMCGARRQLRESQSKRNEDCRVTTKEVCTSKYFARVEERVLEYRNELHEELLQMQCNSIKRKPTTEVHTHEHAEKF